MLFARLIIPLTRLFCCCDNEDDEDDDVDSCLSIADVVDDVLNFTLAISLGSTPPATRWSGAAIAEKGSTDSSAVICSMAWIADVVVGGEEKEECDDGDGYKDEEEEEASENGLDVMSDDGDVEDGPFMLD